MKVGLDKSINFQMMRSLSISHPFPHSLTDLLRKEHKRPTNRPWPTDRLGHSYTSNLIKVYNNIIFQVLWQRLWQARTIRSQSAPMPITHSGLARKNEIKRDIIYVYREFNTQIQNCLLRLPLTLFFDLSHLKHGSHLKLCF